MAFRAAMELATASSIAGVTVVSCSAGMDEVARVAADCMSDCTALPLVRSAERG